MARAAKAVAVMKKREAELENGNPGERKSMDQETMKTTFSLAVEPSLEVLLRVDEARLKAGQLEMLSSEEADKFLEKTTSYLEAAIRSIDRRIAEGSRGPK